MRTLLAGIATILAIAVGCIGSVDTANSAERGLTWKVDRAPFRLTVLDRGRIIVRQQLGRAGAGTRLSFRRQDDGRWGTVTDLLKTTPTATGSIYTVATTEPARTATVTVSRSNRGLKIALDLGSSNPAIRTVYEAFETRENEHFLGTGERRDFVDLKGQIVPIKVWHECGTSKPAPFFVSSRGYGVRFLTPAVGRMAFGPVLEGSHCELGTNPCEIASGIAVAQSCFKTALLAYEIYAGTPHQVIETYAARTGRPPLPEPHSFALMKWRDRIGSEAELREDVDRFAAAGIPLGWLIIDNPWEAGQCAGSMQFDAGLFPNPSRTISGLHARGIRVMMWVSPMVRTACGRDYYAQDSVYGSGNYQAIDLTDPLVTATFERRLRELVSTGIDGLKVDRGDEVDFELRVLSQASGNDTHNLYPVLVAKAIERAAQAARGKLVPTIFRAGYTGSQRIATGTWSGDLTGNWAGLVSAIRSAQTAGIVGYSTWGSDVGGYLGSPAADVFVRWSQFGAVSPIFEVGGTGVNATPWQLGAAAMSGLRSAAILHYELFPYHYELARGAATTGTPILRPLALHYPTDERSWGADTQLLVGRDLLAAPVARPGSIANVYLPPGRWVDLGTGLVRQGPVSLRRPTPLDTLPLYLRVGAAIPFNLREPAIWQEGWDLNDQFRAGRGGWLIAPGGRATSGSSVEYGSIKGSATTSKTKLQLIRARRETQVAVVDRRLPVRVTIDGKPVARSSSAASLRQAKQGWFVRPAPTGGIVLKLAPRGGRSTVSLEY